MNFDPSILASLPLQTCIGNDVVCISNFEKSLTPFFINKVYTDKELEYIEKFAQPLERYASTFCAKEAIYKALKQWKPDIHLSWKKIEILREKVGGKPSVTIHLEAYKVEIGLTISHDGDYVWALAWISH